MSTTTAVDGTATAPRATPPAEGGTTHGGRVLDAAARDGASGRARLAVTRRGAGVATLGALTLTGGLVATYPGLVACGAALLTLVVVSLASVVAPAPLEVRHRLEPARTPRHGEATAHVTLRNRSSWYPLVLAGEHRVGDGGVAVTAVRVPPRRSHVVRVALPTRTRGLVEVGPFTLERRGVADLVRARQGYGVPDRLVVTPRVLPAAGPPAGRRRGHVGAEERVEHGGTDLVGMREYVPGDDLRRLHWATSARTGVLMVREDADPAQPHLTVLLDDRAASYPDDGSDGFEEAVDVAASLVTAAAGTGAPVRCVSLSRAVDADVPAGVEGAGEPLHAAGDVTDRLTTVRVVDHGTDGAVRLPAGPTADVLVVVTGAGADPAELLLAGRGAVAQLLLVVDPRPRRVLGAVAGSTVLRAPRAEDLLRAWDLAAAS